MPITCIKSARSAASVLDNLPACCSRRCHSRLPSSPKRPIAAGTPCAWGRRSKQVEPEASGGRRKTPVTTPRGRDADAGGAAVAGAECISAANWGGRVAVAWQLLMKSGCAATGAGIPGKAGARAGRGGASVGKMKRKYCLNAEALSSVDGAERAAAAPRPRPVADAAAADFLRPRLLNTSALIAMQQQLESAGGGGVDAAAAVMQVLQELGFDASTCAWVCQQVRRPKLVPVTARA